MIDIASIIHAKKQFGSFIRTTPLERSDRLSRFYGANIFLKREDLQSVRSYKIRGAYNLINSLSSEERARGVVCASAGNHAQGVAITCHELGIRGTIFMPRTTPGQKVYKTKKFGQDMIEVILTGDTFDDAARAAREYEKEHNAVFVHPFDDPRIIAGQGTIGLEIVEQCHEVIDYIITPIGGGGLVSGIISAISQLSPQTRVIGVEPAGAASMHTSLTRGENTTLDKVNTFVDGAAVKRVGDMGFAIAREYGLEVIDIPENRLASTILEYLREDGIVLETAGALSTDALKDLRERICGKNVVLILSGSNFDFERLPEVKERSLRYEGLKRYVLVNFPQRPGALKEFLSTLGEKDDIVRFEYLKKSNKEKAPALIGIETDDPTNFEGFFERMRTAGIYYEDVTDNDFYYDLLI